MLVFSRSFWHGTFCHRASTPTTLTPGLCWQPPPPLHFHWGGGSSLVQSAKQWRSTMNFADRLKGLINECATKGSASIIDAMEREIGTLQSAQRAAEPADAHAGAENVGS